MAKIEYSPRASGRLSKLEDFAPGAIELILRAVETLADHPFIGRAVHGNLRELVVSRGRTGYVVLYSFVEVRNSLRILNVRHQREVWQAD